MSYLAVLHWKLASSASYMYGSQITYLKDGSVIFSNSKQAPGTALHYWLNASSEKQDPYDQLPLLVRGKTYAFHIEAKVEPANSIAVNINFLDRNNQVLSKQFEPTLDGEFQMPVKAESYQIELLNINNTSLHFYACYLSEVDTMRTIEISEPISSLLLHIHDYAKPAGRRVTVLRQRIPTEWLPLSEAADQYFLRVPGQLLENKLELTRLSQCVQNALHLENAERIDWRAMTYEAELAMKVCRKVFQKSK
ncbi:accessory Sec system protein Asp3 [Lacticaseibacillus paracasei]|uniref:accessory Sec system protein Asp3 n=1 Tax=Lacticaseibacillus paracasei TaxID=1597 RepID=UPI001C439E30|nr:accessory Sec system protein Asp3 [Lacticaseibacillus paracasei]QXJ68258.1 accessory Sec system protein Asp3 [Lacticaseibacillus paracasei subsp. paracasei]